MVINILKLYTISKELYEGEWDSNVKSYALLYDNNELIYTGNFKNDLKNGHEN